MDAEELRLQEMAARVSDLQDEFALLEHETLEAAKVTSEAAWQARGGGRDGTGVELKGTFQHHLSLSRPAPTLSLTHSLSLYRLTVCHAR